MNRPIVFRPQAEQELLDAERWYEDRKPGLGREFRAALDEILARVSAFPLAFRRSTATNVARSSRDFPTVCISLWFVNRWLS